jgi:hypothetical protein
MKAWYLLAMVACGGFVAVACGDSKDESTGSGGTGGSGSVTTGPGPGSGTTTTTTTSSGTGGGGPSGICGGMPPLNIDQGVYDGCLSANCCDSFDPCAADMDCLACLQNPMGAGCDTNTLYQAFQTCFDTSCPTAICDTMLAYQSPNTNACINNNCCATFNPCEADMACNQCLQSMDPEGMGCLMNQLYVDYTTCKDASCPSDICGTGILFVITYTEFNMAQDEDYVQTTCAQDNCCTELTECADPSMDGHADMNDAEVNACLACLNMEASCMAGAVQDAANAFGMCMTMNCPSN